MKLKITAIGNSAGIILPKELLAGATTFLTMAYIVFVNPDILATTGMDHGAVFVATCLAAALGSLWLSSKCSCAWADTLSCRVRVVCR